MYRRNRNRPTKVPLVVKEVILPKKEVAEYIQSYSETDLKVLTAEVDNLVENTAAVTLGSHEVKPVNNLFILQKKPLENYFEGSRWKKEAKKKVEPQKANEFNAFSSKTGFDVNETSKKTSSKTVEQPGASGKTIDKVIQECFQREENIQRKKLLINLHHVETLKKHREWKSHLQQRLEEKKYIQQQENLRDTWMELIKRKKQLKELSFDDSYPKHDCRKSRCRYSRVSISVLSREYWNDDNDHEDKTPPEQEEEEPEREKTEPARKQTIMDGLSEGILEKLVFVDDDDSND